LVNSTQDLEVGVKYFFRNQEET